MRREIPIKTTTECTRSDNEQSYKRVDEFSDGRVSEISFEHKTVESPDFIDGKHYLTIDASKFSGVLTNTMIVKTLQDMDSGLRTGRIRSLKAIGLTDKNCEADIFRRQIESYLVDGSFSRLKEVVFESGYTQDQLNDENFQPTMLPSKPFPKAELDFIKFDGQQYIPNNFLFTTYSVENVVCPDNDNTHYFLNVIEDRGVKVTIPEEQTMNNAQDNIQPVVDATPEQ